MDALLQLKLDEVQTESFRRLLSTNVISLSHQMSILNQELQKDTTEAEKDNINLYLKDTAIQFSIVSSILKELEGKIILTP